MVAFCRKALDPDVHRDDGILCFEQPQYIEVTVGSGFAKRYIESMSIRNRNLLIIDGHNFLWKAYGVPFKFFSKKGTPLHVTTVFLSLLRLGISAIDVLGGCTDLAIVFDSQEQTSNHLLSKEYKSNRKMDYSQDADSPFRHLSQIVRALKYFHIKTFERSGIEADDLIASLEAQYTKKYRKGNVFIASSDSDFYQLMSKNIRQIIFGRKGVNILLGSKEIKAKLGINPKQYVYFKSLMGDKADNIVGIPHIGPIQAAMIVNKKFSFKRQEHAALLSLNRKLIELDQKIIVCKNW